MILSAEKNRIDEIIEKQRLNIKRKRSNKPYRDELKLKKQEEATTKTAKQKCQSFI